jgi:NAD(P)-dependent dehydrogenase (short-subunit alcohol dehydrogenase family)
MDFGAAAPLYWCKRPTEDTMGNGIEKALVIGAGGDVGKATATALAAAGVEVLGTGSERNATDPAEVAALFDEADPDLVVVAAGAAPQMAPIDEQSWDSFSAIWNTDVRIAFEVGRAALARPLRPGSTVVIVTSGAALGGSPRSGGYAGAKRTQMFIAAYLQGVAEERGLGIRFVGVAPLQLIAGTAIGAAAASAYGGENGETVAAYMERRFPVPLDSDGVARAILAIAAGEEGDGATNLGVSADGVRAL